MEELLAMVEAEAECLGSRSLGKDLAFLVDC